MDKEISTLDFDQIEIGMKKEFDITITESMLDKFSDFSGDYNPLHTDESYASTTKFQRRICHGMLLASFFSRLIGMEIPGKNALYFSQSLDFKSPGHIGDKITIQGEIIEKRKSVKMITMKTSIYNKNKCLVDGMAKVILRK